MCGYNVTNGITTTDIITICIAVLGAVLGIINTLQALNKDRVKLRVIPKMSFFIYEDVDSRIQPCIEVINVSIFPISINQIGFSLRGGGDLISTQPFLSHGEKLPVRLESRSSTTIYFPPEILNDPKFRTVKYAFAKTQCGLLFKGRSKALAGMIKRSKVENTNY